MSEIRVEFAPTVAAPALARDALMPWLGSFVDAETAMGASLAATEIVANAVRHGGLRDSDTIRLLGVADGDVVRIELEQDSSAAGAHLVLPEDRGADGGGFGLAIVDELSSRWGVKDGPPGVVWFEVPR